MPYFYSWEQEERYRDGRRDAAYGRQDHSIDCQFGDAEDRAYCRGVQDEMAAQRERELERIREEEEQRWARERRRQEEAALRQQEEEMMMQDYYDEQLRQRYEYEMSQQQPEQEMPL